MALTLEHLVQQTAIKRRQRDETFAAFQQVNAKAEEIRQRILTLDGSIAQLMELEAQLRAQDADPPAQQVADPRE
jgi:hypothetical protein